MTPLETILSKPIEWTTWSENAEMEAFLKDLQANILKGHGRDFTANILLTFDGMSAASIKTLLHRLAQITTPALTQLIDTEVFKQTFKSGGPVYCIFLARGAYAKMGIPLPTDQAYQDGMQARGKLPTLRFNNIDFDFDGINDPDKAEWESSGPWSHSLEPDAFILVADDTESLVKTHVFSLQQTILNGSGAHELGIDLGRALRRHQPGGNPKGEGIEHFGYVDGRSLPLFLAEDIATEPQDHWSPAFNANQFIVPDPNGAGFACGSYYVYRKLEQHVRQFKFQEEKVLQRKYNPSIGDRAGALVVGRFEDGTPVAVSGNPIAGRPMNDFAYPSPPSPPDPIEDDTTRKCPFRAHIRKTNPRTDETRARLMARRAIPYGLRKPDLSDEPDEHVGLIFMAYMADISEQFEFTQAAWANNVNFPVGNTGVDAVIGQRPNTDVGPISTQTVWHDGYSDQSPHYDFKPQVRLMGGEYFFAPSISFLASV